MIQVYWLLHLLGLIMAFLALGGLAVHAINGGERQHRFKAPLAAFHGLGLVLALVGGFGLQARGNFGWPAWLIVKIGVWVVLGALYSVLLRKAGLAKAVWFLLPLLAALALSMVLWKPFT